MPKCTFLLLKYKIQSVENVPLGLHVFCSDYLGIIGHFTNFFSCEMRLLHTRNMSVYEDAQEQGFAQFDRYFVIHY